MRRALTISLDPQAAERLERIVAEYRLTRSEAVRMALVLLEEALKDNPILRRE